MSVAELAERVRELEAALGIDADGGDATYSARLLALLAHLDAAATPAPAVTDASGGETIEAQLARLKALFGGDIGVGDQPLAATIEEAVAAIQTTLDSITNND